MSSQGHVGQRGLMKTRESASWRERRLRIRSLDYLNHGKPVSNHLNLSNHSGLLLLERRKGGDHEQSFPESISAPFCACSIYFCLWYLLPSS